MRTDEIRGQIGLLEGEQHRLRGAASSKIATFAKNPEEGLTDDAVNLFRQADNLAPRINALHQALESARVHDEAERRAAFAAEHAARIAHIHKLARARVEKAAAVDKALDALKASLEAFAAAGEEITDLTAAVVHTRDRALPINMRGDRANFTLTHARGDGPAFTEALVQRLQAVLPRTPSIAFPGLITSPERAKLTVAGAALTAAFGLEQRLGGDSQ